MTNLSQINFNKERESKCEIEIRRRISSADPDLALGKSAAKLMELFNAYDKEWQLSGSVLLITNAYYLYDTRQTYKEATEAKRVLDAWLGSRIPVLIASPSLSTSTRARMVRESKAAEEKIRRYQINSIAYGIQILKVSTIFLPPSPLKAGLDAGIDTVTHTQMLKQYLTTENPELVLNPEKRTWKDTAYKMFRSSATGIYLVQVLYLTAQQNDYIDETNPQLEWINLLSTAATVFSAAHFALQTSNLIAFRE